MPIVLYHGTTRWKAPVDVAELMADCPEEPGKYRPSMRYFSLEEHAEDPERLAGMENRVALVFRFEQCRTREELRELVDALRAWALAPEHRESVKLLISWVQNLLQRRSDSAPAIAVLNDFRENGAMLQERIKEWEKELLDEGKAQGKTEGVTV